MKVYLQKKQRGAVLIIALIMLLILTILGVAVMESSVIEERMAGNNMTSARVFQMAELALREAEADIQALTQAPIAGAHAFVNQLSEPEPTLNAWWEDGSIDAAFWEDDAVDGPADAANGIESDYYIEEYTYVCDEVVDVNLEDCTVVYRITARAAGGRNSTVLLQSLYSRKY